MQTPSHVQMQAAAKLAVSAFDQLDPAHASRLQATATGWALLALLANAAAKLPHNESRSAEFYAAKEVLLYVAICMARDWWATPHAFADAAYQADTVVYIQSDFGRFAFHTRRDNATLAWLLQDPPVSSRGWGRLPMQKFAPQLAEGYLSGPLTAAEIIALHDPGQVVS